MSKGYAFVAMACYLLVACGLEAVEPDPGGACMSFQAVTCTVYPDDHAEECLAAYGTWREDGDCLVSGRTPILMCKVADGATRYWFSWYASPTQLEIDGAHNACNELGGAVVP